MAVVRARWVCGIGLLLPMACQSTTLPPSPLPMPAAPTASVLRTGEFAIEQVSATSDSTSDKPVPETLNLARFVEWALAKNPTLQQAVLDVDIAQGKALQAGLYPNPVIGLFADELGDRTGPSGILTLPQVTQEIVTGGKLTLAKSVAQKDVDLATLSVIQKRYDLLTKVRQGYLDVLSAQKRIEILTDLVGLSQKSVDTANKLLQATEIAKLDVLQLEVALGKLDAELAATKRERQAAFGKLVAEIGLPELADRPIEGSIETDLPDYDFERAKPYLLKVHPEIRVVAIQVERSRLNLAKAQAEPIPNLTVGTGYTRQNQNSSNDWLLSLTFPVPVFNRNQGTIYSAQADISKIGMEGTRVQNDLTNRLWAAYGVYASARQRVEIYKTAVLPKAEEAYQLANKAFVGGQFEYLKVLQAQRAVLEAQLEYIKSLTEGWTAAATIAGLLLEERFP